MFNCDLTFWLQDTKESDFFLEVLQKISPQPYFTHKFFSFSKLEDIQPSPYICIILTNDTISPLPLQKVLGTIGKCFAIGNDIGVFSEEELDVLYDFWQLPLDEKKLTFFFKNLLKRLAKEREAWLISTYLDRTINTLPDLIWFKDKKGAHLMVNDAFCELVNKTKEDIKGRGHYYIWDLTEEMYEKGEFVCLETEVEVFEKQKTCLFDEQVLGKDGLRQLKTYKTPIFDPTGVMVGTVGIARDVTVEKQHQEQIIYMALHDALTGLANRRYLYEYVEKKEKEHALFSLVYFDLDHFKEANDTYGHAMGDEILVLLSKSLQHDFPEGFAVRLGGDEFLLLVDGKVDEDEFDKQVVNFIKNMNSRFEEKKGMKEVTLSAGIVHGKYIEGSFERLLHLGDIALYHAKNNGRARAYKMNAEGECVSC